MTHILLNDERTRLIPERISPAITAYRPNFLSRLSEIDIYVNPTVYHDNGIFCIDANINNKYTIENILTDVNNEFELMRDNNHLYSVSTTGLKDVSRGIGSERFCCHNYHLANYLTNLIKLSGVAQFNGLERFVNVSQYFRFMRYFNNGEHFPHYDSDYNIDDYHNTRMSCVTYFGDCYTGEFAFVKDSRNNAKDRGDWDCQANREQITSKYYPRVLRTLIFSHELCHTVLPFIKRHNSESRIIARGDLIFRKDIL